MKLLSADEVKAMLEKAMPGAKVAVRDLTGTSDHFEMTVVSDLFAGKGMLDQHRMVKDALAEPLKGPIHALTLKTYTPEQWAKFAK